MSRAVNKLLRSAETRPVIGGQIAHLVEELASLEYGHDDSLHGLAAATHYLFNTDSIYLKQFSAKDVKLIKNLSDSISLRATSKLPSRHSDAKKAFTFTDLFAGIGGFHLALTSQGGKCVFASEWDTNAKITYLINHGMVPFGDIRQFTRTGSQDRVLSDIRRLVPRSDVISAGFPCQPFSLAGVSSRNHYSHDHGLKCDTQGTLFHDIVLIAKATKPKALLLENVRNLSSHDGGRTIRIIRSEIEQAGYVIFPTNVDSKGWAVIDSQSVSGQRRKRVYMVCIRRDLVKKLGPFEFPNFTSDKPRMTLRDVIALDQTSNIEKFDQYGISEKLWKSHLRRDQAHADRSNGFRTNIMHDLDQPSPTLVARYFKDGKDCLIPHPQKGFPPRMLTPLECAILQTYPKSFWIPESKSIAYKQFGNSITVEVARRIARQLANYLSS